MEEKISVIITVYNLENYLDKCIESIINQTYTNLEIIIIDDESSDNSNLICQKWVKKDKRIQYFYIKHVGVSGAKNIGLKKATSKYISFIDGDDYIEKDFYEIMYNNLIEKKCDMAICNLKTKVKNKIYKKKSKNDGKIIKISREILIKELLTENIKSYFQVCLFKKELFYNIEFPKDRKYEDIATSYKVFNNANNIVYINKQLFIYNYRENSITNNIKEDNILDQIKSIDERYQFINKYYYEYSDENNLNRIKNIYRYYSNIAKFLGINMFNKRELIEEYEFYRNNYKKYNKRIKKHRILYEILFYNKKLFYYIIKFYNKFTNKNNIHKKR